MSIDLWAIGLVVATLLVPAVVQLYVHRLPVAPACPSCNTTTRSLPECLPTRWMPPLAATFVGECSACGWRGRMRWRWAVRAISRRPR